MKRKTLSLSILTILVLSSFINIQTTISANNGDFNGYILVPPEEKIGAEILEMIIDNGGIDALDEDFIVKVIIMFHEDYSIPQFNFPDYVDVLDRYDIINGVLAYLRLDRIYELAKFPQIRSIWLDRAENSIPTDSEKAEILGFLETANGQSSDFVNFTDEIGATDLWKKNIDGSGVIIAVLDSGIDITGQIGGDLDDFDDNINTTDPKFLGAVSLVPEEPLYYTDFTGKGTYHAGLACGTGHLSNSSNPRNKTYAGVAPGASYLNVKIYDSIGLTYWSFMISGVEWAIQHSADILLFCTSIPGLYLDPISVAITNAVKRGLVVVTPTGDEGPSYMSVTTPGGARGAISVGAYDVNAGLLANFSGRGPGLDFRCVPDIIAPGVDLIGPRARIFTNDSLSLVSSLSGQLDEYGGLVGELIGGDFDDIEDMLDFDFTIPDGMLPRPQYGNPINENYTKSSGTGAAAAVVAGAMALLIQAFPLANPQLLRTAICETSNELNGDLNAEGCGVINVSAAYDYLFQYFGSHDFEALPFSVPLPYAGVITNTNSSGWNSTALGQPLDMDSINAYDMTTVFSTQALMDAVVITNGTSPDSFDFVQIHTPLNQFGLLYENRTHWFSEFQVVREFQQMSSINIGDEDYNRYIGILKLNGLYVIVTVDTWNYVADYITVAENEFFYEYLDRINGLKFNFRFLNLREDQSSIEDIQLVSYFKADLFLNETGALSNNTNGLDSILEIGMDDNVTYDPSRQVMSVYDMNNNTNYTYSHKYASMGINSTSHKLNGYRIDNSIDLIGNLTSAGLLGMDPLPEDYFDNSTNYERGVDDPGFVMLYDLDSELSYGSWTNWSGLFTVGIGTDVNDANSTMNLMMDYMMQNVTDYEVKDIVVVESDFHRMHYKNEVYSSEALILNVGNTAVNNCQIGFGANRYTESGDIETFATIKSVDLFELDDYYVKTNNWTPQDEGIYLVGWVVIDIASSYFEVYTEDNILNNILARSVYVVDKTFYNSILQDTFNTYPHKLDQEPMTIHFPGDIAIYNICSYNIMDIPEVTVSLDGAGSNYLKMMWNGPDVLGLLNATETEFDPENASLPIELNDTLYTDVLHPYDMICVIGIGPLLCPEGIVSFNITFSSPYLDGVFYRLPVEFEFREYRGRIFFDGIHNFLLKAESFDALLGGEGLQINLTDNFIDLEERLDYPFASYNDLKELWAGRSPKGAALQTILPGININITDYLSGLTDVAAMNETETGDSDSLGIDVDVEFDLDMFSSLLGGFTFEGDNLTTNQIDINLLQIFDVLIISDPELEINGSEIEDIVTWVENGGSLFVWAENSSECQTDSLNDLLNEFNLTVSQNSASAGDSAISSASWQNTGEIFNDYNIGTLIFRDPVEIDVIDSTSEGADAVEKLCPYISVAEKGKGRVCAVGDKDLFTIFGLKKGNNTQFAEQLIDFGLKEYFDLKVTPQYDQLLQYKYNIFDADIQNYGTDSEITEYTDDGVLFICAFIYEDSTTVNVTLYGFDLPLMLMFETTPGSYATSYYTQWYNQTGTYYAAFLLDDPAGAQELVYVEFEVLYAPAPPPVQNYDFPTSEYPHWIDIVGILWVIGMGLLLWAYNLEKWKTRLKIIQLEGPLLNKAKTRINEGTTLLKQILKGMRVTEDEQEQIRLFLSYRKRLSKYLKDLKKFGEDIGEHY